MRSILVLTAACATSYGGVTSSSSGRDHAKINVDDHAAVHDFVAALDRALDRHAFTDCMLLVNRWRDSSPDPIRITAPALAFGATPICGPNIADVVASFAQGGIFITPAGGGPMYVTDRPLRDIEERDRPATIPHIEAVQRVAHHAPDQKRVVIAAPMDRNAYEMLRLVNDVAAYDTQVSILFYFVDSSPDVSDTPRASARTSSSTTVQMPDPCQPPNPQPCFPFWN